MWLGEEKRDLPTGVIHIEDYFDRRERLQMKKQKEKGEFKMSYLPFRYVRELTDLPSNTELVAAGLEPLKVVIKTKLQGKDELAIADAANLKQLDAKGNVIGTAKDSDVLMMVLLKSIVSWNLKDSDTGEAIPVSEASLRELYQDDFDYISTEINKQASAKLAEAEATAPKEVLDEAEKNLSPLG